MLKQIWMATAISCALAFAGSSAMATGEKHPQQKSQAQKQKQMHGSQMMTQQERDEYRTRMRAAKTAEERDQIRKEYNERMKERARKQGMTFPDKPPAKSGGAGMDSSGGGY